MGTRTSPCTSSHMQLVVSYKQPTNNKTRIAREQNNIIFTVQLVVSKVLQQISDKITMSNEIPSRKWTDHLQPHKIYSHVQTCRVIYRLCTMIMIHRSNFQNEIRNRKYNNFNSQLIKANYQIYPQIVHRAFCQQTYFEKVQQTGIMKLSIPRKQQATRRVVDTPPIPLDRQVKKTLVRSQYITLKLLSNPTEDTSQTYCTML